VDIDRVGGTITIRWNGIPILSGTQNGIGHSGNVQRLQILFGYYANETASGTSVFGTESIDQVRVLDTAVLVNRGWGRVKALYR
jgi:hypothetical protein